MKKFNYVIVILCICISTLQAQNNKSAINEVNQNISFLKPSFNIGFLRPIGAPDDFKANFWGTLETQLNLGGVRLCQNQWDIDFRLGLYSSNYYLNEDYYLATNRKGDVYSQKYPEGTEGHKTSLFSWGIESSLMTYYKLKNDDKFGFGLIWRLTTDGFSKVSYKDIDEQNTTNMYNVNAYNKHCLGIKAEYEKSKFSYYVKYIPSHIMHEKHGPAFSSFSFGLGYNY